MSVASPSSITQELDLPEGWESTSLGAALEVKYGRGLKEEDRIDGRVPVYGSNGVVGRHSVALTKGPTIIIGRKGSIGAVHYCSLPCWPIDTTYFIDDFRGLEERFVAYALRLLTLSELDTSTAIPGLNRDDLYSQTFPLAPVAEQKRIAVKVEQLLASVNTALERLEGVPPIIKRFRQTVLATACSGGLTADWRERQSDAPSDLSTNAAQGADNAEWPDLPETWSESNAESACALIVDCPHSTPKWTTSGVICLRTTNFRSGALDLSDVRYVSESTYCERTQRLVPREGDVLYSREGGILGLACLVPRAVKLCLGQRMMLMRAKEKVLDPTFFMHVLNSPQTNQRVRQLTGGSASPHLNVQEIKRFPVPLPPFREQLEIVRRVEVLFKLANAIEKRVADATLRAKKLTAAILAKAFRGELVPTEAELARREGRPYESAADHLARIQSERTEKQSSSLKEKKWPIRSKRKIKSS